MPRPKGCSKASILQMDVWSKVSTYVFTRSLGMAKGERKERPTVGWWLRLRASFWQGCQRM